MDDWDDGVEEAELAKETRVVARKMRGQVMWASLQGRWSVLWQAPVRELRIIHWNQQHGGLLMTFARNADLLIGVGWQSKWEARKKNTASLGNCFHEF